MTGLDPRLEGRICCPECQGELVVRTSFLDCHVCALAYPLQKGVPILLKDRAKKLRGAGKAEVG
jgi:uncharacterized protein YbaR (Trm112 family)